MKQIHVLWIPLCAAFAVSAVISSSAFAVGKVLLNGAEITSSISAEASGELLLEDMNMVGKPDILCSAVLDINIEAGGATGSIEAELTLSKELLESTSPLGDLIECEAHSTCTNPLDEVEIHLPWDIEVKLTVGERYYLLAGNSGAGEPGTVIDCNTLVGLVEDTCTTDFGTSALLENVTGGILSEFLETETEGITPPGNCTLGGASEGLIVGSGLITSPSGTLSLSE
jgi:hypothetical protein